MHPSSGCPYYSRWGSVRLPLGKKAREACIGYHYINTEELSGVPKYFSDRA